MDGKSNNNAKTAKSIFAIWYIKCTDLTERSHYPTYPYEECLCGFAESKETAEAIMREYNDRYVLPICIGYRIEEYPFNECGCDSPKHSFSYDSTIKQLEDGLFSVGDPVEVLRHNSARLGVITEISSDDIGTLYYVCTDKTSPHSTFCRLENLRMPNFSISHKDFKAYEAMSRAGLTWKKCQEKNLERAGDVLRRHAAGLGRDGIEVDIVSSKYSLPEIVMSIPDCPEPGWKTEISVDMEKILTNRRKTYVTLRTIVGLPTNGERYAYRKRVVRYKKTTYYSIFKKI